MRFRPCIDIHNGKVKQIVGEALQIKEAMPPKIMLRGRMQIFCKIISGKESFRWSCDLVKPG